MSRHIVVMQKHIKKVPNDQNSSNNNDFIDRLWTESWTHIKTVVDTAHEPFLILDKNLSILGANQSFYRLFQLQKRETVNKSLFEICDGQWNIVPLKKLLENILPQNTFFRGFEVVFEFPTIGKKNMILNARRIYREALNIQSTEPIILLAMEDTTELMNIADVISHRASRTDKLNIHMIHEAERSKMYITKLKKEVKNLKEKLHEKEL